MFQPNSIRALKQLSKATSQLNETQDSDDDGQPKQDIAQSSEEVKDDIKQDLPEKQDKEMAKTFTSGFVKGPDFMKSDLEESSDFRKTTESFSGIKKGTQLGITK